MTRRLPPSLVLFFGLLAIYNSNLRPIGSGDVLPGSLLPLALVLDHTIALDRFAPSFPAKVKYSIHPADGHWYGVYPIAGPVLIAPLYLPLAAVPGVSQWQPETLMVLAKILGKLVASAIAGLSAVILLQLLLSLTSTSWAWILTLVYALGTETWAISSQSLWQHTFGQLAVACALLFLHRAINGGRNAWFWALGAATGFALLARLSNAMLLPAVAVGLLVAKVRVPQLVRFAIPALACGAALALYNFEIFGSVTGYYTREIDESLAGTWMEGAVGMLVSPGRGLFMYSPVLLFGVSAFLPAARAARRKHRALLTACCVFMLLHSVVIAKYPYWWAGHCWGPRYMTEIMAPMVALITLAVPSTQSWKRAFAVLAVYSVMLQAVGAYFYPHGLWDVTPVILNDAPQRVWDWKDNPVTRAVQGGIVSRPYRLVGAALNEGKTGVAREIQAMDTEGY